MTLEEFKEEIEKLFSHVKDTPTLPGFQEIMIPGEIEYDTRIRNLKEGILLEEKTWTEIIELSKELGVCAEDIVKPAS